MRSLQAQAVGYPCYCFSVKNGSQSLVYISQVCGSQLPCSLGFGELGCRDCEVTGVRETSHRPASTPRDGEGLSSERIILLEEQVWLSRDQDRSRVAIAGAAQGHPSLGPGTSPRFG